MSAGAMVRGTGIEPVTPSVSRRCSTTEPTAPVSVQTKLGRQAPQAVSKRRSFRLPGFDGPLGVPDPHFFGMRILGQWHEKLCSIA